MQDIDFQKPRVHVFLCVNDRGINGNSCGPFLSVDQFREVKQWLLQKGLVRDVYCTKVGCLGFCNNKGAVAVIYPKGRFVTGITCVDDVKKLILEEISKA